MYKVEFGLIKLLKEQKFPYDINNIVQLTLKKIKPTLTGRKTKVAMKKTAFECVNSETKLSTYLQGLYETILKESATNPPRSTKTQFYNYIVQRIDEEVKRLCKTSSQFNTIQPKLVEPMRNLKYKIFDMDYYPLESQYFNSNQTLTNINREKFFKSIESSFSIRSTCK
jgi:hypothetical protein